MERWAYQLSLTHVNTRMFMSNITLMSLSSQLINNLVKRHFLDLCGFYLYMSIIFNTHNI